MRGGDRAAVAEVADACRADGDVQRIVVEPAILGDADIRIDGAPLNVTDTAFAPAAAAAMFFA